MTENTVLHLITRFLGGGAETTTENEVDALLDADADYKIHLGYGSEHDPERVADVAARGVKSVCFDHIRHYSLGHTVPAVIQVTRYLRRHDVDIIHTHSTEAGIIGRWAAALARTSYVIHEIHGDPISEDRNAVLNTFVIVMERITAGLTTKFIIKSERIREDFLERGIGNPDQYELIYHGVDFNRFLNVEPAPLPESSAESRLLYVGRLSEGKGLFDLLDSFEDVVSVHDVDLIVAGDGALRDELVAAIDRAKLTESVFFLGYRSDVPELLAASDALVLPSYREGTPRVISEAIASGTPVVATGIAGIPEQVKHGSTGLLIEPGDIDQLVSSLSQILSSEEFSEELCHDGCSTIPDFSLTQSKEKTVELYTNITQ